MRRSRTAVMLAVLVAGQARADESRDRQLDDAISVDDNDCVDRARLASQIADWIGTNRIDARVAITVRRENDSVLFRITREEQSVGQRSFDALGMSCERMTKALALTIAIALDATLLDELEPPRKEDLRAHPPAQVVQPPPAHRSSLSFRVGILGLVGVLPRPSVGFDVGAAFRYRAFEVGLSAFGTKVDGLSIGRGTADIALTAAHARGCVVAHYGLLRPSACAGLAAGPMVGQGFGFSPSFERTNGWLAGTARVEAAFAAARWLELAVHLDALVPFIAPRFDVVDEQGVVVAGASASPIGGALGLAAQLVL